MLLLGAIFWILHRQQALDDLVGIWRRSDKTAIALAVAIMMAVHLVCAARLQTIMLEDGIGRAPLPPLFRIQLVSLFATHGAPISALGDLARAAMVALRFGLTIGRSVRIVLYERVCAALGTALVGFAAAAIQLFMPPQAMVRPQLLLWTGALLALGLLLTMSGLHLNSRFELVNRAVRAIAMLGEMLARPLVAIRLALISLLHMIGLALVFIVLAAGMHIAVPPLQVTLSTPLIFFVSSLPIFYLGWGAREAIVIATLASASVSNAEAVALSVAFGVVVFLSSLPGAMFWLLRPSMRKAIAEAEAGFSASGLEQA